MRVASKRNLYFLPLLLTYFIFTLPLRAQTNVNDGPGGPILVISSSSNPFSLYPAEMLRAEGWNAFKVLDISAVNATVLNSYDVVILGEVPVNSTQVSWLNTWTSNGGTLIAFRPNVLLHPLLGITATGGTLSDRYLYVNQSSSPGAGIVAQTIQYHGTADLYTANAGTSVVATLFSSATAATSNPAVTLRSVGSSGGQAIAFAYDLAKSVVYTRQGNPAWAGQKRDGQALPIRSDDMFFPDWVDLNKVAIPQADEQQRLLSNIIVSGSLDRKPLPRFWFLPKGLKAAVIETGDDHDYGQSYQRFDQYLAYSTDNSAAAVANWTALRNTAYIYPGGNGFTDASIATYQNQGFEVALHLNTNCAIWTAAQWANFWDTQWAALKAKFPSIRTPETNRTHCISWSDWATQPKLEAQRGVRLDCNYYYWPGSWVNDRPGMFTGSGIPMRFADLDGTLIDCYQVATQMTDESGQTYPKTINALLDSALGTPGYYGVFCSNIHNDDPNAPASDAIVASAKARNIPVITAKQMLDWLDGKSNSNMSAFTWNGNQLGFSVTTDSRAFSLKGMLPTSASSGALTSITRNGAAVSFTRQTIKGIEYAFFDAVSGNFVATYGTATNNPPVISNIVATPNSNGTAVITWNTDKASNSRVDYGTTTTTLGSNVSDASLVNAHSITITGLTNNTTYYFRVTSVDASSNSTTSPAAPATPLNFTVPAVQTGGSTYNIFTTTPAFADTYNDGQAIELGVKFRVTTNGTITGVRFYKTAGNTGTHTGRLYSSTGTLLASAVFSGETASGWQTVTFATPVNVVTGTTYVASYHSASGNYTAVTNYFTTAVVNGPVRGLANGEDGVNGVYRYTATPAFPSTGFQSSNYGVDVVYSSGAPPADVTAPVITAVAAAPNSNGTAVITWTTDEASDTRVDYGTASGTLNLNSSNATLVTSHTVTLTGLTPGTTYFFRVTSKDASNNSATSPLTSASPASFLVPTAADVTPPTISAVSAVPNSNGTALITWTTNENSDSRVDYGTASGTLNLNSSNATLVTSHAITLTGLTPGTTYFYTVTSKDASNNSATSPTTPASFTVPTSIGTTVCGTDDTNTNFSAGTLGTNLSSVLDSNGALTLKPAMTQDFTATTIPTGWTAANWQTTGASTTYTGGAVTVNGSHIYTTATYAAGASLEFSAKFTAGDYQNIGFSANSAFGDPWVVIGRGSVGTGTGLYVRTSSGVNTLLSSTLLNAYHRYKITWNATNFTIWVDGVNVATATMTVTTAMNVHISDYNTGTPNLAVDWVRVSPYATTGTFTSRVIDAGSTTFWKSASWNTILPTGTSIAISYRTGNSATPDGTWSAWTAVTNGGALTGNTRYLQYQAVLTTTDVKSTPVLKDISFSCSASPTVVKLVGTPMIDQTVPGPGQLEFRLAQNRPNPFTARTTIEYAVPRTTPVRITVYDLYGRIVRTYNEGTRAPGRYTVNVELNGLTHGVYYYTLQAGDHTETRKMIFE